MKITNQKGSKIISLVIDSSLENIAMIGVSVFSLLRFFKYSEILSNRIEVAIIETVTNSIRHSYQNQPGKKIEVVFNYSPQCLTVDIIDSGIPIDQSKINPVQEFDPEDTSSITEGGMGLFLIYKIMDKVTIRKQNGKNIWTLIKNNFEEMENKE